MKTVVIVLVIIAILVMGANILGKKWKRKERTAEVVHRGTKTSGSVFAKLPQSGFDQERGQTDIRTKLSYLDPMTNETIVTLHVIDRYIKDLPPVLAPSGSITVNAKGGLKAISAYRKDIKDFEEKLRSEGYTSEQIRHAVTQRITEKAREADPVDHRDNDGYLILKEPIPVDVYVLSETNEISQGDSIAVVFTAGK